MNRFLIGAFAVFMPLVSMAEAPSKAEWQNLCKRIAQTDAIIMEGRQQGVPMIKSMKIARSKGR